MLLRSPWNGEQNYVTVFIGDGCWSWVGMEGGEQQLSLDSGCWSEGTIVHEFIHAFGYFHEQSRPDRDQYVQIIWENILEDKASNYAIKPGTYTYGVMYDGKSVMHYLLTYFTNGNGPTMKSLVCIFQQD